MTVLAFAPWFASVLITSSAQADPVASELDAMMLDARAAARSGRCAEVAAIGARIRERGEIWFTQIFQRDEAIVACRDPAPCANHSVYLDPTVWAGFHGPTQVSSIGLHIALGYAHTTCDDDGETSMQWRAGGFFGTGRLAVFDRKGVDTETGLFGAEAEATWALPGTTIRIGPGISAAEGNAAVRVAIGGRARYRALSLGVDVVHVWAPLGGQYPSGTLVAIGGGVSFQGTKKVAIAAGVGVGAFIAVIGVIAIVLSAAGSPTVRKPVQYWERTFHPTTVGRLLPRCSQVT